MRLMYPHEIDRYRLIGKIVKAKRKAHRTQGAIGEMIQTELAKCAAVPQSTISNIENQMEDPKESRKHLARWAKREDLLKALSWGLELKEGEVNALLWLYDGISLREEELRHYMPHARFRRATDEKVLRKVVLALIEDIVQSYFKSEIFGKKNVWKADAEVIFGDKAGSLEADRKLLEMENILGQRLMVTEYVSHLTHPMDAYQSDELVDPLYDTPQMRRDSHDISKKRVEIFSSNLDLYGERSIHSKSRLKKYLQDDASQGGRHQHLTTKQRRKQIQQCIKLLKDHEYYDIRLAETTPELELELKSSVTVMMRAARRYERDEGRPLWGPRYIHWSDEISVLLFLLDFEKQWDNLSEEQDKGYVIEFLERIIQDS